MYLIFLLWSWLFNADTDSIEKEKNCIQNWYEVIMDTKYLWVGAKKKYTPEKTKVLFDEKWNSCVLFDLEGNILSQIPIYQLQAYIIKNQVEQEEMKRQKELFEKPNK